MSKKISIALIGCGYWGNNILKTILEIEGFQLVAIIDKDKEKIFKASSKVNPNVSLSTSIATCSNFNDVEAVIVAVPVHQHFSIVKSCLTQGKHVLCEKVLSEKTQEITILKELALNKGLALDIGFTYIHHSGVQYIREVIKNNDTIGGLLYVSMKRVNYGPIRKDVDVLTDLSVHDLSMCLYWLGCPQWVSAITNSDSPDYTFMQIGYQNFVVNITCSWLTPIKQREIEIVGSKGIIVFDDLSDPKLKIVIPKVDILPTDGSIQYQLKESDLITPDINNSSPLYNQLDFFYNNILARIKDYKTLDYSLSIANILNKARHSYLNQGIRVEI